MMEDCSRAELTMVMSMQLYHIHYGENKSQILNTQGGKLCTYVQFIRAYANHPNTERLAYKKFYFLSITF